MVKPSIYIYIGLALSLIVHGGIALSFDSMAGRDVLKKNYKTSVLIPIIVAKKEVPKPPIKKKKIPKKKDIKKPVKIIKKTKVNPVPVSHKRLEKEKVTKVEDVKPVFGVTKKTVEKVAPVKSGIAVRVGNTLMKEQEEEYTPLELVSDYITIPIFDLTILPEFKSRVTPGYPELLENQEIEGKVFLSATIDDKGKVIKVRVIRSDHELFTKAATAALLASVFTPASQNGAPVGTILDDLVYTFVLDE